MENIQNNCLAAALPNPLGHTIVLTSQSSVWLNGDPDVTEVGFVTEGQEL